AARAMARDRVFAAVEAEVARVRAQTQQRRAPRALAAADVEHAAQRALEVVLGGGDRERDLARQALRAADAAAAVPGVEIALVVAFGHGVGRREAAATIARLFASVAARNLRRNPTCTPTCGSSPRICCS